jgi:hypothetical protein
MQVEIETLAWKQPLLYFYTSDSDLVTHTGSQQVRRRAKLTLTVGMIAWKSRHMDILPLSGE